MFSYSHKISQSAEKILSSSFTYGGITVVIGENGAGKSSIIAEAAGEVSNSSLVSAVANTPFHKFQGRVSGARLLQMKSGKTLPASLLKRIIPASRSVERADESIWRMRRVLERCGYDDIGITLRVCDPVLNDKKLFKFETRHSMRFMLSDVPSFGKKRLDEQRAASDSKWILGLAEEFKRTGYLKLLDYSFYPETLKKNEYFEGDILWLWGGGRRHAAGWNDDIYFILKRVDELKAAGLVSSLEVFFRRDGEVLHVENASSGELSTCLMFSYVASRIKQDSLVFVDEPENSLHPRWQKDFASFFFDTFESPLVS
ncbi:AAA family ATPase [Oleidesulfovibrio sp.]|uniref:AAA family ATPase n=1 Tax=Oleidesulfovibrio sp. TaxID=2909707 RepID=UPI003A8B99EB